MIQAIRPYKRKKCSFKRKDFIVSGVYLIYSNEGELLYVGMSSTTVHKQAYRHFQKYCRKPRSCGTSDKKYQDTWYPRSKSKLFMFQCRNPKQVERFLISSLKPIDNRYLRSD